MLIFRWRVRKMILCIFGDDHVSWHVPTTLFISFSALQWKLSNKIHKVWEKYITIAIQTSNWRDTYVEVILNDLGKNYIVHSGVIGKHDLLTTTVYIMCLVSPFQFFASSCSNRVLFCPIFIFPERLTTTRPAQVTLPICCVGADTDPGSQSPFKALHKNSLPLQWYLTLHLHIQIFRTPVFASCLSVFTSF